MFLGTGLRRGDCLVSEKERTSWMVVLNESKATSSWSRVFIGGWPLVDQISEDLKFDQL